MNRSIRIFVVVLVFLGGLSVTTQAAGIVHDAEYYILEAQNGERWAAEDGKRTAKEIRCSAQHHPHHVG